MNGIVNKLDKGAISHPVFQEVSHQDGGPRGQKGAQKVNKALDYSKKALELLQCSQNIERKENGVYLIPEKGVPKRNFAQKLKRKRP